MSKKIDISEQEIEKITLETLQSIQEGENSKVKILYKKVEKLFKKGNDYSQSLIANKFIYPLTSLLEMNYSWGATYLTMLPICLKKEYHSQIYASGI